MPQQLSIFSNRLSPVGSKLLTRWSEVYEKITDEKCIREGDMLWTRFVILLVLCLLGVVSSYTMGGIDPQIAGVGCDCAAIPIDHW